MLSGAPQLPNSDTSRFDWSGTTWVGPALRVERHPFAESRAETRGHFDSAVALFRRAESNGSSGSHGVSFGGPKICHRSTDLSAARQAYTARPPFT